MEGDSIDEFRKRLYLEIASKYLKGKEYDPLSVSLALRIKIEEIIYHKIMMEKRDEFIKKNGTKNKLKYAEENNVDVDELFYMLGILYNDPMHLNNKS